MEEFNFNTEEGKKKCFNYIKTILEKDNKEEIARLLFGMMGLLVEHGVSLHNIKSAISV